MQPDVAALVALAEAKAVRVQLVKAQATEAAVLAALTAWFGSKEAITADQLPDHLIDLLVQLGVDRQAVLHVGEMATVKSLSGRGRHGSPEPTRGMTVTRRVASEEPHMRAMYVLAAAKRLSKALADDRFNDAVSIENTYLMAHVGAGQNRRRAAKKVDDLGDHVLVWRTAGDSKVEAACASLEGRLFTANTLPGGAIPGAVTPRCRCHAEVYGRGPLLDWGFTHHS